MANEERMNRGMGRDRKGAGSESVQGAVTQKHRNRLGMADGEHNPNGVGEPSKEPTVANGTKRGW